MDIKKVEEFIKSDTYDYSKKKAYSLIFVNLGVALVVILALVAAEMIVGLIVFAALLACYLVIIFCLNAKITEENALTFLSHSITILMAAIGLNFALQAILVWFEDFTLTDIFISLAIQIIAFVVFVIVIPMAVKSNHYKKYSAIATISGLIGVVIVGVVTGLIKFNSSAADIKSILLVGVFNFIIVIFTCVLAQMLIKWHYCRKYNIAAPNRANNKKTNKN